MRLVHVFCQTWRRYQTRFFACGFFAHHALHFFLLFSSTFSSTFDLFFAICISGFVSHYIISIHINLWTWCEHDTDTGLPPRKPRFDKSWFYIRDCHLVWGLTWARPSMLNILHMLSNMCVFAYIVCYINTFIFFYGGTPPYGILPRKPRLYGITYGIVPCMGVYGGIPRMYTFHGPPSRHHTLVFVFQIQN